MCPQIVVEETPFSILSRAGREVTDAKRAREMYALDKQRAEFELATEKQEQARKIESEDAFRDGAEFAIKNAQGFDSPLQQQARAIGAVQRDPGTPGYEGKGAFQITTKAQEEYAAHEKQMMEESAAIASRMSTPKLAQIHMENERARITASRVDSERKQTIADLSQWFKNDPNAQADEAMAAGFEQVIQNLQRADPFDEGLPQAIDDARGFMLKGIEARAQSEAVGRQKIRTFEQAGALRQQLQAQGALDDSGVAALEYMQAGLEGLPVHTLEDWEKYKAKFDDALVRQMDATLRRRTKAQTSERAAKDPVAAGALWDESVGEARQQVLREASAGMLQIDTTDPDAQAQFEREVFGRAAGIFQDRGGPRGFVEQKGRAMFPPAPTQKLPPTKYKLSALDAEPGRKARAYRLLAELKLQGASAQEARVALAQKMGVNADAVDMAEVMRQQDLIQRGGQGKVRQRFRELAEDETQPGSVQRAATGAVAGHREAAGL